MQFVSFLIALAIVILFGLWSRKKRSKSYKKEANKIKTQTLNKVKRADNPLRRVK